MTKITLTAQECAALKQMMTELAKNFTLVDIEDWMREQYGTFEDSDDRLIAYIRAIQSATVTVTLDKEV